MYQKANSNIDTPYFIFNREITKSQSQNHKINYGSIMLFLYVIMFHYILLFINKVLYYIRNPFLHIENPFCDFVIVIL